MEKINLPDGRTLNLPSDLPIETRNTIAEELQRDFGIDINQAGVFERVLDAPKSVLRGATSLLTDVPLGISALTLGVDDERTQALQGLQRYLRTDSILASDPNLRDKFTTKLAEGAGSFVPFLGAGMLGARLAKEGVVKPATGAFGIPAALAVPTGIAAQADRIDSARAMGEEVGPVAEKLALLGGGAIGTTEILPIAAIFRRIPRNVLKYSDVRDKLKSAALTGTFEGGQEVFASVAQDLVARGLYSDELPIGESLFEEFTIGGIIGAGADLLVNSMNRRSVTLEHLKSREEAARKKLYSIHNDEKFTKAQEQGDLTVFQEKPIVKIPDIEVPENLGPNPDLAVIQNPDTSYSVVDINNPDNPVLQSFKPEEENKALAFKNKTESNFLRKKLATEVAFANFFQGLQESGQAKQLGFTILDPNNTEINLQTLLDFDKSLSEEQRLALKKEKDQAYGPRTYNEIFQNRKERLPLVSDYLNKKGLPLSASFTITEAKNTLPNRQFNELMRSLGNVVFQANEGAGFDSLRTGEKVDTTLKAYRELAKSKNIELDFNDPAVQFATEQWTGIKDIRKTQNKGVRELFLARLQSLKPFNNVTPFPDYRPRPYTVEDMNAFVEGARDGNFVFNANDLKQLNPSFFENRPEVAEQFFNDLVKSGRIGPSERKGKYKVNPNYEFDVARRAGGFFETPEQFRARLQAEGKLPQEIIDNLYNQELINQEGLIPPKPFEEQIINFREAVEQGRVNKFAQESKKLLDKIGLKETGVIVSDELLSTTTLRKTDAQGNIIFDPKQTDGAPAEYDKNTDIIFISLNAINPDGVLSDVEISARIKSLVEHELIHALRTKDLITEPEYQFLRKEVKRRKVPQAVSKTAFDAGQTFYTRAAEGYAELAKQYSLSPEATEELFVEEAIAELFRHRDVTPTAPKKVDGIFNKIVQFFTELGTAFRSSGYQRASELFADIEQGRVGSRERGQIRTLLALDKRPPEDAGLPTVEDDEPITPNDVSVTYDAKEIAEGAPEDTTVIGTPVPVESDTKPITGVVVKPPSRVLRGLYDVRNKTIEELQADRLEFINGIGGARERKNSLDVLDWLIKNGPRGDYKLLAERFRDQMVKIKKVADVDFGFTVIQKGTDRLPPQRGKRISTYLGVSYGPFDYNGRQTMQIYINDIGNVGKPGVHGVDYNTILHELVHQVTQANVHLGQYLRGDEKTNTNYIALENLRKRVKQELKKLPQSERDFYVNYGVKNVHEFLAVGFTDRVMQKFMEDIKTDKKSKKSLWDQFTTIIRRILGIPAKAGTVFSEFLKQGGKITNLSSAQIRQAFGDSFVAGTVVNATPRTRTSEADAVIGRPAEPEVTDVPNFSVPENTKESLQQYIDFTEDQIFRLEKESVQEGGLMTPGSYKRLQGRIRQAKRNLSFYQEKLLELNKPEERDPEQLPLFALREGVRNSAPVDSARAKKLEQSVAEIEEQVRQMPNGEIPPYNLRASDVALDAALDYNRDQSPPELPDDVPNFSVGTIPDELKDAATQVDNNYQGPTQSFGRRMIELFRDPTDGTKRDGVKTTIAEYFNAFRREVIDKYNDIEKALVKGGKINDEVRDLLNNAATSAIAAIRMADRSRGVFQGLLNVGYVVDQIDGESSLPKVLPLEIQARYNKFVEAEKTDVRDMSGAIIKQAGKFYGGLTKILMPLYSDPQVDKERIFKIYAALKRISNLQENGREIKTPIDVQKAPESIEYIEQNFPEVVEAYNNYQVWNNRLIDFAKRKGLLSEAQADLWIKHSSYYPFYKTMIDDTTQGPRIAAGVLPNNPLQIKLEGSENPLNINPVEAISRNSLAILTGSLKNDGVSKLIEQLNIIDPDDATEATTPAERKSQNTIPYFVDGQKKFAILKDPAMFHAIQGIGGISTDIVSKVVGFPARILRDTVTRDPGFIMVNLLRDTLSATVTSGVPLSLGGEGFTPIKDTFYNMTQDMNELEAFGVLGGYDFQNDEGSVKQFVDRAMRKQGLNPDNSMKVEDLFYKVWDGLGALTTKSDGATRLAVYHAVYKDQKANGASEAQAQSEAAFQALEIINFGRRGLSPVFRIVTSAIPFLNARIQGLDVLWRSASGQYSSIKKLQPGQSPEQLKKDIMLGFLKRGGMLAALTGMYYLLVSDTDEYKNLRREVRDDNWVIPLGGGYAAKIPIPFEVGMMFKAFPERLFDLAMGEDALSKKSLDEAITSMKRQLGTSANIPFLDAGFGIQLLKPIAEVYLNRNTFTNTDIIPYYQTKLEPALQQRASTNEVARQLGETFNMSPIKIEHIVRGYTGTLGGYLLDVIDAVARGVTGTPITPPNITQIPVINRLLMNTDRSGGIQQQYYELRNDVDRAVQTLNKLRKEGRMDEYSAYRSGNKGVLNVKAQVRAIDRYLENWRRRRDQLLRNEDMSPFVKTDLLEELEAERDRRLAIVPELRKKANVPITQIGNF